MKANPLNLQQNLDKSPTTPLEIDQITITSGTTCISWYILRSSLFTLVIDPDMVNPYFKV
jgi:hypothetical protein